MKRRLFCILLSLSMAAALSACGQADAPSNSGAGTSRPPASQSGQSGTESAGSYVFVAGRGNSCVISIDDNMADVLAALGEEPQSYFEAASCAFEGLDKTYTFSGFTVTTRPDGEQDYVNSILLTDDIIATPEGVYIGCSADDVTAAYGEGSRTENVISYTRGNSAMNFVLEGDKVISIEYLPA